MKYFTTSTALILSLLTLGSEAITNEVKVKTGFVSVFRTGQDTNISKPLLEIGYETDLGPLAVIFEGGATLGDDTPLVNNSPGSLADYTKNADNFQYLNVKIPYKTTLHEKEVTLSAGPSIVTYQSTEYTVNDTNTGYNASTSRKLHIGLSTEATLNLMQTKSFGVDISATLPVNFHTGFGAGFSFGAVLGINI